MYIKKSLLMAGVVTTVALASVAGVSAASNNAADGPDNLANKIAKKFNLKPADVKAVFNEDHKAHAAERQQKFEAKLDQLVKDGTITADQKAAILAKEAEMKTQMEADRSSMKDKTPGEREALMDQKKAELEQWAKDNGISTDVLAKIFNHGPGGGRHHGMGPGMHGPDSDADDSAQGGAQEQ